MTKSFTPETSSDFGMAALRAPRTPVVAPPQDDFFVDKEPEDGFSVTTTTSSLEIFEIFRADQEADDNARLGIVPTPAPGL